MKLLIGLNILCFVLFALNAAFYASQDKLVLTIIWSFGALCWVACAVLNYRTLKMRDY